MNLNNNNNTIEVKCQHKNVIITNSCLSFHMCFTRKLKPLLGYTTQINHYFSVSDPDVRTKVESLLVTVHIKGFKLLLLSNWMRFRPFGMYTLHGDVLSRALALSIVDCAHAKRA